MTQLNETEIRPMLSLPTELFTAITKDSKQADARTKSKASVLTLFRKHEYLWTDLKSPKGKESTCTPELWDSIKSAIVLSWTDADQVIWNTPTKELTDSDSRYKRETLNQSRMGGRISDYCKALKKDQVPKKDPVHHSDIEKIAIAIQTARELIQETEEEIDFDASEATESLRLILEDMGIDS